MIFSRLSDIALYHLKIDTILQWDFVCENAELAELTQTLLIIGMMLGTFVCPTLSGMFLFYLYLSR